MNQEQTMFFLSKAVNLISHHMHGFLLMNVSLLRFSFLLKSFHIVMGVRMILTKSCDAEKRHVSVGYIKVMTFQITISLPLLKKEIIAPSDMLTESRSKQVLKN